MKSWEILLFNANVISSVLSEAEPGLAKLGLETKPFMVLASLEQYPHPAELAKALMLPNPTISFLVKKLESSKFLLRQAVEGDLRKFKLTLTKKGRDAVEKGTDIIDERFAQRLKVLSKKEIELYLELLSKLNKAADSPAE